MEDITFCEEKTKHLLENMMNVTMNLKEKMMQISNEKKQYKNDCNDSFENGSEKNTKSISNGKQILTKDINNTNSTLSIKQKKVEADDVNMNYILDHLGNDEEICSLESRPINFTSSVTTEECDFRFVEAFLPQILPSDEDNVYESSQTVFSIAKLVSNLNLLQKKCVIFQEQIDFLKNELAISNTRLELRSKEFNHENCGKFSDMVDELYSAQQEREASLLARMQIADQSKDQALIKAHALLKMRNNQILNHKSSQPQPGEIIKLLDALCQTTSSQGAENCSNLLLKCISGLNQEKKRIMTEETMNLMKEHNNHNCQKTNTFCSQELQNNSSCHVNQLQTIKEQIKMCGIYLSLSKSMESTQIQGCCNDAQRLVEALKVATEHADLLEIDIKRNREKIKRLEEKNKCLERLVSVLQKKLVETEGQAFARN